MKNYLKISVFLILFSLVGFYFSSSANAQFSGPGTYKLINPHSGRALDVTGGGTGNGTNVEIWADIGSVAQQWSISQNSDGTYTLFNPNSGKALDVYGGGTANGTNVDIWANWAGNLAQEWNIIQNSNGTYKLINPNSGKALDVYGEGTANGTNVDIWADNGHLSEQWNLDNLTWSCDRHHCYGVNSWPGNVDGASTDITIPHMSCINCNVTNGYFFTNEMWVGGSGGNDWIEAGENIGAADTGGIGTVCSSECYFFADERQSAGFHLRILGNVPSQDFGNKTNIKIVRQDSATWNVYVKGANSNYSTYSGPNTMVPDGIQIGSEFHGYYNNTVLSANLAYFDDNMWEGVGSHTFNYQTVNGNIGTLYNTPNSYPVVSNWTGGKRPSDSGSNGGEWYTECPSSQCY